MKPSYSIGPVALCHLRNLVPNLREGDLAEVAAMGMKPRHLLFRLWRASSYSRSALIDGQTAAVWGCTSSPMEFTGEAWLLTGKVIETLPLAYFKEIRYAVQDMLRTWHSLTSAVGADYEKAIRFMRLVGFTVDTSETMIVGGTPFYRMRMER